MKYSIPIILLLSGCATISPLVEQIQIVDLGDTIKVYSPKSVDVSYEKDGRKFTGNNKDGSNMFEDVVKLVATERITRRN